MLNFGMWTQVLFRTCKGELWPTELSKHLQMLCTSNMELYIKLLHKGYNVACDADCISIGLNVYLWTVMKTVCWYQVQSGSMGGQRDHALPLAL